MSGRGLPFIDRCSLCSWAHCDTPTDGVCTHPDMRPRCAPIDPTKPPIGACPLRAAPDVYAYVRGEWHVSTENSRSRTTLICSSVPMADLFDVLTTNMRHDECTEEMRRAPLCGRCFNPRR